MEISNYLIFKNKNSKEYKKIKKMIHKTHLFKIIETNGNYNYYLKKELNKFKGNIPKYIGVLFDTNQIIDFKRIISIPKPPKIFDILCLDGGEINEYINENENGIWSKVKVNSSGNFIINTKNIGNMENLFEGNVYSLKYNRPSILTKNENILEEFDEKNFSINTLNYPKISLISIISDKNLFFHVVYTFLKLDYPSNCLELIILNKTKKKLNKFVEDERIKIIYFDEEVSFGEELNIAISNSTSEILFHFFEGYNYNLNLKHVILNFIMTNKQCICQKKTFIQQNSDSKTQENLYQDLGTLIYTKNFWKMLYFSNDNEYKKILKNFIFNRLKLVGLIDYKYVLKICEFEENENFINNFIDEKLKESFRLTFA